VVSVADKTTSFSAPAATASLSEPGLEHLTAGRHAEAVASLKQSIKANPNDALAYVRLGMAHSALHQYAEAVGALNKAIRIKREAVDAAGYFHLGHSYVSLNQPWEAINAFRQALYILRAESVNPAKTNPAIKFEDLYYSLGVAYHNAGRYNDAIRQLKEAVKLNPKLAEANYGLGAAYLAMNDTKSAQGQLVLLRSLDSELANKLKGAIDVTTHNGRNVPNRTNRVF
jgi:tetratricopeptide (TPR) repeat protein